MARDVNITYSGFRTGTNVTFQRRLLDVSISYKDNAGSSQIKSGTVVFPDILQSLSAEDLKEIAIEIMLRSFRNVQGVDL